MTTAAWARSTRLALLTFVVLFVAGCQLDVRADVVVEPDGSGRIVVTASADAELVDQVPTIADDLVLDDFADAGWTIDGPMPTADGGLTLTLSHDFEGNDEATNLLRSLGPPFNDASIGRREDGDTATNTFRGNLGLIDGFASFADDELIGAVGEVPFSDQFAQEGVDESSALAAELIITLPGVIEENNAIEEDGRLRWSIPTDGTILEASARTEQAPSEGAAWARPLATAAQFAFIIWVVAMGLFISYVVVARARRARRYRRRSLP
ncbi:MAG: hypothetical protein AB8G26_20325 [Ilumatobacter sp.]